MPDIQMIALDLDGTLLRSDKQIDPETAEAIRHLHNRGVHIVLASARPPRSVRAFYQQLGLTGPQINYNGALIWDEPARSALHHAPIAMALVREIVAMARQTCPEVIVQAEVLDRLYTDRVDAQYDTETGRLFPPDVVAEMGQWDALEVTKLMLLGAPAHITLLRNLLARHLNGAAILLQSDPHLLQIAHRDTGKGAALRRLARRAQVAASNIFAIGDAENDLDMLDFVGFSVAMQNAPTTVKSIASRIAPTNDQQGVLVALRSVGLV